MIGWLVLLAPSAWGQVAFQPTIGVIPDGATMSTVPVVTADRRYVRLGVNPSFIGFEGFSTFPVPGAVGGGPGGALPGGLGGLGGGNLGGGGRGGAMNGGAFNAGMNGVNMAGGTEGVNPGGPMSGGFMSTTDAFGNPVLGAFVPNQSPVFVPGAVPYGNAGMSQGLVPRRSTEPRVGAASQKAARKRGRVAGTDRPATPARSSGRARKQP
jgi:hypothetical protein